MLCSDARTESDRAALDELKSRASTATTMGADWPCAAHACGAYVVTSSITDEVVRIMDGAESRNAEDIRSS